MMKIIEVWFFFLNADMKRRAKEGKRLRPSSCGTPSSSRRPRPGLRTCCTRITVTASQTSRTWGPSNVATCVPRLWSTAAQRRWGGKRDKGGRGPQNVYFKCSPEEVRGGREIKGEGALKMSTLNASINVMTLINFKACQISSVHWLFFCA